MGLIKTISNFCYIECDMSNCNRKMEHIDEVILKQLAGLCNWENQDGQWMCPDCLTKAGLNAKAKDSLWLRAEGSPIIIHEISLFPYPSICLALSALQHNDLGVFRRGIIEDSSRLDPVSPNVV